MTISREKCLEMVGFPHWDSRFPIDFYYPDIEALINRAYAEGQRDMRERAAKEIEDCSLEVVTRVVVAIEVRNLEID